ncbi:MAG: hypothetical protein AB7O24_05535 [Kofleriaceae bacterium]
MLAFVALVSLSSLARSLISGPSPEPMPDGFWTVFATSAVAYAAQLAAGCALAWQMPSARWWVTAFVVAIVAMAVAELSNATSALRGVQAIIEAVGVLALVVVVPRVAPARPHRPRCEGSAMLTILGASGLLTFIVAKLIIAHKLGGALMTEWLWIELLAAGPVWIIAICAGWALRVGTATRARRALKVYYFAAMAIGIAIMALTIAAMPLEPDMVVPVVGYLIAALGVPLLIYLHVIRDVQTELPRNRSGAMIPAWVGLALVPFLAARVPSAFAGELGASLRWVAVAIVITAIANAFAGIHLLKHRVPTLATMLASTASMTTIVVAVIALVSGELPRTAIPLDALSGLCVANAIVVWRWITRRDDDASDPLEAVFE